MMKREFVLTRIRQELERIFHLRAFIPLPMHLLLPYSNSNSTGAAVGTTSGSVNTIGMGRDDSAALHQRCMFLDHSGLQLVLPVSKVLLFSLTSNFIIILTYKTLIFH